jgi:hypothetical protein
MGMMDMDMGASHNPTSHTWHWALGTTGTGGTGPGPGPGPGPLGTGHWALGSRAHSTPKLALWAVYLFPGLGLGRTTAQAHARRKGNRELVRWCVTWLWLLCRQPLLHLYRRAGGLYNWVSGFAPGGRCC